MELGIPNPFPVLSSTIINISVRGVRTKHSLSSEWPPLRLGDLPPRFQIYSLLTDTETQANLPRAASELTFSDTWRGVNMRLTLNRWEISRCIVPWLMFQLLSRDIPRNVLAPGRRSNGHLACSYKGLWERRHTAKHALSFTWLEAQSI